MHPSATLTDEQVRSIRQGFARGKSKWDLAHQHDVPWGIIHRVVTGKGYGLVK